MTRNTQSMYDAIMEIAGMMIEDGYTAAEVTAVAAELQEIKSSLWDLERATGKDLGTKMIGGNSWLLDKVAIYMEAYFGDTSRDFWAETYEDAAIVSRKCAEIIDPIYYNDDDENTDDADALMMVCDRYHLEEFEECPNPALQAEIDEAKREEDDEYHTAPAAEPDLDALRNACPDFAYCGTDAPEVEAIQEKLRAADDHADVDDDSWMDNQCFTVIHAIDKHPDNKVVARPTTWREKLEMEDQLHDDGYEFVDTIATGGEIVALWYRPMMPWPEILEMTKPSTSAEEE